MFHRHLYFLNLFWRHVVDMEASGTDNHDICSGCDFFGQIPAESLILVAGDVKHGSRRTAAAISGQGWARSRQYHAADVWAAAALQKQLYVTSDSGRLNLDL